VGGEIGAPLAGQLGGGPAHRAGGNFPAGHVYQMEQQCQRWVQLAILRQVLDQGRGFVTGVKALLPGREPGYKFVLGTIIKMEYRDSISSSQFAASA
jgi:hypothetical protein